MHVKAILAGYECCLVWAILGTHKTADPGMSPLFFAGHRLTLHKFPLWAFDSEVAGCRDLTVLPVQVYERSHGLNHGQHPAEMSIDRAPAYLRVLGELLPSVCHVVERYANGPVETDHGCLKARLRSVRGLRQFRSVRVISIGHAVILVATWVPWADFRRGVRSRPGGRSRSQG